MEMQSLKLYMRSRRGCHSILRDSLGLDAFRLVPGGGFLIWRVGLRCRLSPNPLLGSAEVQRVRYQRYWNQTFNLMAQNHKNDLPKWRVPQPPDEEVRDYREAHSEKEGLTYYHQPDGGYRLPKGFPEKQCDRDHADDSQEPQRGPNRRPE